VGPADGSVPTRLGTTQSESPGWINERLMTTIMLLGKRQAIIDPDAAVNCCDADHGKSSIL
jgi:hypothetical protein